MDPSRRPAFRTVVVGCVVTAVLAATLLPLPGAIATTQQEQPQTDNTITRIAVAANGSAHWTIQIRTRLDTDQRVAEYEAFQDRFRANTSRYLDPFRQRIRDVVANARNATGRDMTATDFEASTSIQQVPRRWGVVTYEFTWTSFAAREDGSLVVGDVFEGGFFLAAGDRLEIVRPETYAFATVEPEPLSREDGVVTWSGREDFADNHPRVVFEPTDGSANGTAGPTEGSGPTGLALLVIAAVLVVLALGATGVAIRRHRQGGSEDAGDAEATTSAGDDDAASAATASAASGAATGDSASGATATVRTDPEKVLALLDAHDDRMRQAAVGEELDWSASKTSRVVGDLVEDGRVEKLKLGRENLLERAEEE